MDGLKKKSQPENRPAPINPITMKTSLYSTYVVRYIIINRCCNKGKQPFLNFYKFMDIFLFQLIKVIIPVLKIALKHLFLLLRRKYHQHPAAFHFRH
jgi:hypothetical protein